VEADGLMTDRRGVTLVKHSADCVSIYLLYTARPAIALLHAGWRGTVQRIAQEGFRAMARAYGTRAQDCLAAIGPSIGLCCFEVGEEVTQAFEQSFPGWELARDGHVDLWRCNQLQLEELGVPPQNICVSGLCTACDTETFYSHRAERGTTGSMAAFLMLK
jgi:YfiH family protein